MDPIEQKKQNEQLTAAITTAIDLDSLFKLYSYRCIPPDLFIQRATAIVQAASQILDEPVNIE